MKKAAGFLLSAFALATAGGAITTVAALSKAAECGKSVINSVSKNEKPEATMSKSVDCGMDFINVVLLGGALTTVASIGGGLVVASRVGNKKAQEPAPQTPSV